MDTISTDHSVEAHVVVAYDPDCPHEVFLSFRQVDERPVLVMTFGDLIPKHSALIQARSMVAPHFDGRNTK